jgi:hypothetical protein
MLVLIINVSVRGLWTNNNNNLSLFAAKKLFDIKLGNMNLTYDLDGSVCGVSGDLTLKTHVGQFRIIGWDNGHSGFQFTFDSKTYESNGKLIANVPVSHHTGTVPAKGSNFNFHPQESVTAVCTGNSETPGKNERWLYIFTVEFDETSGKPTINAVALPI